MNEVVSPLDNVSFHSETSVHKSKYVLQRGIAVVLELDIKAFDCKEVLEVVALMKIVTYIGFFYEKLFVNELSVNITVVGNVEGCKEYKVVNDSGKCEVRFPILTRL